LTCDFNTTDETCVLSDGSITITNTGGTMPYEYSIDGGTSYQSSNIFAGLVPGSYTVITRDANACTVECSLEILPACFDLALIKEVNPAQPFPVNPGDIVNYIITVFNQGTVDAFNIQVVDYVPSGMINVDPAWMAGAGTEVFTTFAGPLAPGTSTQITLQLQIDPNFTGGDLQNFAEISDADDDTDPNNDPPEDGDSTPDDDPDNDGPFEDNDTDNTNDDSL